MTATLTGTTWDVDRVVSVTDGDTLRIIRSRSIDIDGKRFRITDDEPKGVPVRLAWVDTPERGDPGWAEAGEDLRDWVDLHSFADSRLRVIVFGSSGWDRLLVDLIDEHGNSASQWLMRPVEDGGRGWPAYAGGKA